MSKYVTLKVFRPDSSRLSPEERREYYKAMAVDLARQLEALENQEILKDQEDYWKTYFLNWDLEVLKAEVEYEHQQRNTKST